MFLAVVEAGATGPQAHVFILHLADGHCAIASVYALVLRVVVPPDDRAVMNEFLYVKSEYLL